MHEFNMLYNNDKIDYSYIPEENEKFYLNWKHNLASGSTAEILSKEDRFEEIVKNVSKLFNLKFASVDIIELENGELKIMEVNSGIVMKNFASISKDNYKIAKEIYREAVLSMFKN